MKISSTIGKSQRTRRVISRIAEHEFQAYLKVVQTLGITRSRMMRKMISDLVGQGPDLLPQDMRIIGEGVYQLGALGRNLNQLLRAIHSSQLIAQPADMTVAEAVRDQVTRLEKEWIAVVKRSKSRRCTPGQASQSRC